MKKIALITAFAFGSLVILTACNTMKGAGQDIQRGGEKIENAAKK